MTSVLVLAGSTEAAELVRLLIGVEGVDVVASFAGRLGTAPALPGSVRVGGFGGVDGLAAALGSFDLLVDATHPFAATMPWHASGAAARTGTPRVRLRRPGWERQAGDDWHEVDHLAGAAAALGALGAQRVLLTVGRQELAAFAGLDGVHVVARSIEPPDPADLPGAVLLTARPPFAVAGELALLREHGIDTLVTKNSGGGATAAKLIAARRLGVRIVLVRRPPTPPGPVVATAAEAFAWVVDRSR